MKKGRGSAKILYWRGIEGDACGSEGDSVGMCLLVGVGGCEMETGSGNSMWCGTSRV